MGYTETCLFVLVKDAWLFIGQNNQQFIVIFALAGLIATCCTLYYTFLKNPVPKVFLGKSAMPLFYDKDLDSVLMIDLCCTFLNYGARSIAFDRLEVKITSQNTCEEKKFTPYMFLSKPHYASMYLDKDQIKWTDHSPFIHANYWHPVIVNKYAQITEILSFKCVDRNYTIKAGKYFIEIIALYNGMYTRNDKAKFELLEKNVADLASSKGKEGNSAVEAQLEPIC